MKKYLLIVLLLSISVFAQEGVRRGAIPLLALTENGTGQSGSLAHLSLQIVPGDERVFLETFPMTKITTQASLRFAQQVACKELDVDCSKYDFLFGIRALPGIVGGPSAGSAATLLTAALLMNKTVRPDVALTGTINSGGIIGPVGGVSYKIEAAAQSGMRTVYIPKWTKDAKFGNKSMSMVDYGSSLNVTVKEVATIAEVLQSELGIVSEQNAQPLQIDAKYQKTMEEVANELCARTKNLSVLGKAVQGLNLTTRAQTAFDNKEFYAAASFCFRANVEYKRAQYLQKNWNKEELQQEIAGLKERAKAQRSATEARSLSTLGDLQTFMAVMERVQEAEDTLKSVERDLNDSVAVSNMSQKQLVGRAAAGVGLAEERLFSAVTWARFFDGSGEPLVLDKEALKAGCAAKISEAEERYNYVKSVIPEALDDTRDDIDLAYGLLSSGKYTMCLYTASKAKAEADVLLGVMGLEEKHFSDALDLKLNVSEQALRRAQHKDVFPIIAYSYYEYAKSLRDFDRVSSLLFAEYALELANLDIYFQEKKEAAVQVPKGPASGVVLPKVPQAFMMLVAGLLVGGLFIWLLVRTSIVLPRKEFKTLQAPPKRRLRGKKR